MSSESSLNAMRKKMLEKRKKKEEEAQQKKQQTPQKPVQADPVEIKTNQPSIIHPSKEVEADPSQPEQNKQKQEKKDQKEEERLSFDQAQKKEKDPQKGEQKNTEKPEASKREPALQVLLPPPRATTPQPTISVDEGQIEKKSEMKTMKILVKDIDKIKQIYKNLSVSLRGLEYIQKRVKYDRKYKRKVKENLHLLQQMYS